MDSLIEYLNKFIAFVAGLFQTIIRFFYEFFIYLLQIVYSWFVDLLSFILSNFKFDTINSALAGLKYIADSPAGYWLSFFQLPFGVSVVFSAYLARFLIRRIPFIG